MKLPFCAACGVVDIDRPDIIAERRDVLVQYQLKTYDRFRVKDNQVTLCKECYDWVNTPVERGEWLTSMLWPTTLIIKSAMPRILRLVDIADDLNNRGFRTVNGKPFNPSTVYKLLKDLNMNRDGETFTSSGEPHEWNLKLASAYTPAGFMEDFIVEGEETVRRKDDG